MICPKCQYQRQAHDTHVLPGVCPACGIAYEKWQALQQADSNESAETENAPAAVPVLPLRDRIIARLFFVPSDRHESAFWGHALLFVVFLIWGWSFILQGIDWETINGSFLHTANLAFHEYGHVMFAPFGQFMEILGGSLFQILLPLAPMCYFIFWQHDNFAASIMLWWCGQNFIDVSPYILDAPTRILPLIRGLGPGFHDWGNLLTMTGTMEQATLFAWLCFGIGALLIIASNAWGAALLVIELKGREVLPSDEEEQV